MASTGVPVVFGHVVGCSLSFLARSARYALYSRNAGSSSLGWCCSRWPFGQQARGNLGVGVVVLRLGRGFLVARRTCSRRRRRSRRTVAIAGRSRGSGRCPMRTRSGSTATRPGPGNRRRRRSPERSSAGLLRRVVDTFQRYRDTLGALRREWRNGIRDRFRFYCPKGRGGSTPPSRTLFARRVLHQGRGVSGSLRPSGRTRESPPPLLRLALRSTSARRWVSARSRLSATGASTLRPAARTRAFGSIASVQVNSVSFAGGLDEVVLGEALEHGERRRVRRRTTGCGPRPTGRSAPASPTRRER